MVQIAHKIFISCKKKINQSIVLRTNFVLLKSADLLSGQKKETSLVSDLQLQLTREETKNACIFIALIHNS